MSEMSLGQAKKMVAIFNAAADMLYMKVYSLERAGSQVGNEAIEEAYEQLALTRYLLGQAREERDRLLAKGK